MPFALSFLCRAFKITSAGVVGVCGLPLERYGRIVCGQDGV